MQNNRDDNDKSIDHKASHYREVARSLRVLASTASGQAAHHAFLQLAEKYETLADDEARTTAPQHKN